MSNIKKCVCGNEIDFNFKSQGQYCWKIGRTFFCSYSCYSKAFDKKYNKTSNKIEEHDKYQINQRTHRRSLW